MKLTPRLALLVFVGGAIGTLGRYELGLLLPNLAMLLIVNTIGTFVLGVVHGDNDATDTTRALFGIGFAGGFTTMSGISVLTLTASEPLLMVGSVVAMFALGIAAYALGLRVLGGKA